VPVYAGTGFGLIFHSELPLPSFAPVATPEHRSILVAIGDDAEVATGWDRTLARRIWTTDFADGCTVTIDRGLGGDHLFGYGTRASFHVAADLSRITCAPADIEDASWQRFLLDTVLHCTSILAGFEALHASAVDVDGRLVAFVGLSGGGKTTLAVELVRRGAELFCDDILALERAEDCVVAHPGPPLVNMARQGACPSAGVGTWLTRFPEEGEDWFLVDRHASSPRTPHTIFLIDRRPGLEPGVEVLRPTPLGLLAHSLSVGADTARFERRFQTFSDLASSARLYLLTGSDTTTPAELADIVIEYALADRTLEMAG
jgi:hypothetical protein